MRHEEGLQRAFEPGRVLVIVTRQIGDVLLATPLIRRAARLWPAARIDVLAFAPTLDVLRGNPDVHGLVEAPGRGSGESLVAFARRIWRRYDLAVVTEPSDRAHLYGFLAAGTRTGIVPREAGHAWWKRLLLRHAPVWQGDLSSTHVGVEKLGLLAPWEARDPAPRPDVVPPPARPLPPALATALQPGFVVVHVPSMWTYKQWPVEHYRRLIAGLVDAGRQVVLTGGTSAGDREKVAAATAGIDAASLVDACGRLDFGLLAGLLASAALYVGPDGSVTHLAAAVGTPVLALFGPTNPERWGPLVPAWGDTRPWDRRGTPHQARAAVVVMQGAPSCVPCGKAGCDDHRQSESRCLQGLQPEVVLAEACRVLGPPPDRTPAAVLAAADDPES